MDNPKLTPKAAHLLDDLESIRDLLGSSSQEPPLLTDSLDPAKIPLLSDIVMPPTSRAQISSSAAQALQALQPRAQPRNPIETKPTTSPTPSRLPAGTTPSLEQNRLDRELRAAAQLILQDVIDDFVPQIEAELKRRLEARLERLLPSRKP